MPVALLAAALVLGSAADAVRPRIVLDGSWQAATVDRDQSAPPTDGWVETTVPGTFHGRATQGSRWTWLRRELVVPADWRGRAVLVLNGARFKPRVLLDGKLLAERLEGWTPLEVELPATPGGRHRLEVRCQDWSATFAPGFTLPEKAAADPRRVGGGKVVAPFGGHFDFYGIWDSAWVELRGPAYLADVAVDTSFRRQTLTVAGGVAPAAEQATVEGTVYDGEEVVVRLPAVDCRDGRWKLAAKIPASTVWWSPESPRLYRLQLILRRDGRRVDAWETPIGFRELWAEGPDFVFNGVKRHLLASSGWPASGPQSREEIRHNLEVMKADNVVAFRLHTQPWPEVWLQEADRLGMLIVEEGALWCDGSGTYAYADPQFWQNVRDHLTGMVRRDRNHPSLVMWSLENEILHCGACRHYEQTPERLAELGRFVKALDPTHLITFESDRDPGGVADVVGLHYPHELPKYADYPNTADWLLRPDGGGVRQPVGGSWKEAFTWDRKKPLYIGEYLWVPAGNFAPGTVFFGDRAYLAGPQYNELAKLEAWRHQTIAYRRAGVSAICPWTAYPNGGKAVRDAADAQKEAYEPVASFPRQLDSGFFLGEPLVRQFDVFNDSPQSLQLSLSWTLGTDAAPAAASGEESFSLPPAGHRLVEAKLTLPNTATRGVFSWKLAAGDREFHRGSQKWSFSPRATLESPLAVAVFDPQGQWSARAANEGLKFASLASLDDLFRLDAAKHILVVAPAALAARPVAGGVAEVGRDDGASRPLAGFFARGGRALVLEQSSFDALPLGLRLVDQPATMTFAPAGGHPLVAGADPAAGSMWGPDHYVSRRQIVRPDSGGALPVLVSGGERQINWAAVLDVPAGPGRAIVCQALVGEKMFSVPAARRLFAAALSYLAGLSPPRATGVVGQGPLPGRLRALGLDVRTIAADSQDAAMAGCGLVAVEGAPPAASAAAVAGWLQSVPGATLYWSLPEADAFAAFFKDAPGGRCVLRPAVGPLRVAGVAGDDPPQWATGLCREDLAFALVPGDQWRQTFEPDRTVIDRALALVDAAAEPLDLATAEIEGRFVHLRGVPPALHFATVGTARWKLSPRAAGAYPVTLRASGTPAAGEWPIVEVDVAGARLPVCITSRQPTDYHLLAPVAAAGQSLAVRFINDGQSNGEDRNAVVHGVSIAGRPTDTAQIVAWPPALVQIPFGKGRVVVDCVKWEAAGLNRVKGRRYASALLSALGGSFAPPAPAADWVPAAAFELVGRANHFQKEPNTLRFGDNAAVRAEFQCLAAGAYELVVRGQATPAAGVYGRVEAEVDGQAVGGAELAGSSQVVAIGRLQLSAGRHAVVVRFVNDLSRGGEDRNLSIEEVGFRRLHED